MKITSVFKFAARAVFSLLRMLFVGIVAAVFCVYTVDYLTIPSRGTFNLVITTVYFSLVCVFAVLFVEFFAFFQRRAKQKSKKAKDEAQYAIK